MGKPARAGLTVLTTLALLGVLPMASADAGSESTHGKLKVCFENTTLLRSLELDVVADGPSFRKKTLLGGECKTWKVRPGQYKIALDDVQEFFDATNKHTFDEEENSIYEACPRGAPEIGQVPNFSIEVTRNGKDYDIRDELVVDASFTPFLTNVQKKRKTKVDFAVRCPS